MGPFEIRFNLPGMAASELRNLNAQDPDVHQIQELMFTIGEQTIHNYYIACTVELMMNVSDDDFS